MSIDIKYENTFIFRYVKGLNNPGTFIFGHKVDQSPPCSELTL